MLRRPKFPLWSRLLTVGMPVFRSELRRRALGATLGLIFLLLVINGLNVVISYVTRDFMTALSRREERRFYLTAVALAGVFVVSTTAAVLARYVEERLGLMWRDWLTRRFLERYLRGRAYRRLMRREDVDNPDQRIAEDVKTFSVSTLSLVIIAFNALLAIITFASVLCSITPWLLVAAVTYALVGSAGMILVGRRLVELSNAQYRKEADFRYALVRIREHAEAVAQMAGEHDEKLRLGRLLSLVANFRRIIDVNRNLGFFVNSYNYLTQVIPVVIVAPLYVSRQVEFGTVAQSAMAFTFTLNGFSLIVSQFQQLSSYAAVVARLGTLWEATADDESVRMDAASPGQRHLVTEAEPGGRHVSYQGVTLETPTEHRVLVRQLSLEVPEGRRLIITGPNGAGKTALFMATAGLWESGSGHILRPESPHSMFLPQHPYAITGRLRDHLLYGLERAQFEDARIADVIRQVGLEEVVARVGGLDAERDWSNAMSEGELQTCALARLILARPRFAFLDQTLAMLEAAREERLYAALSRTDITYISIGDHPALFKYHELRLDLHGDGCWGLGPT